MSAAELSCLSETPRRARRPAHNMAHDLNGPRSGLPSRGRSTCRRSMR
jgi:hypothetical protein